MPQSTTSRDQLSVLTALQVLSPLSDFNSKSGIRGLTSRPCPVTSSYPRNVRFKTQNFILFDALYQSFDGEFGELIVALERGAKGARTPRRRSSRGIYARPTPRLQSNRFKNESDGSRGPGSGWSTLTRCGAERLPRRDPRVQEGSRRSRFPHPRPFHGLKLREREFGCWMRGILRCSWPLCSDDWLGSGRLESDCWDRDPSNNCTNVIHDCKNLLVGRITLPRLLYPHSSFQFS